MPLHDRGDVGGVRRASGGGANEVLELKEVIRSEDARRCDREKRRVVVVHDKAVDRAARDADGVAGADGDLVAVDRERRSALESVDRFLEAIVAVRERDAGAGADVAALDGDRAVRLLGDDGERDRDRAEIDGTVEDGCMDDAPD